MNTTTRIRTAAAAALLAITMPLALASCSSSDRPATANDTTKGIGAKWGACMRDAGFEVQDADDDQIASGSVLAPEGADQDAFRAAAQGCSEEVGARGTDSAQRQEQARQYDEVASCIRDNGFEDYPEQKPGQLSGNPEEYPRAAEPEFDRTFTECLDEYAPYTKNQEVG
jgi:hypothetical protein